MFWCVFQTFICCFKVYIFYATNVNQLLRLFSFFLSKKEFLQKRIKFEIEFDKKKRRKNKTVTERNKSRMFYVYVNWKREKKKTKNKDKNDTQNLAESKKGYRRNPNNNKKMNYRKYRQTKMNKNLISNIGIWYNSLMYNRKKNIDWHNLVSITRNNTTQ